MVTYGMSDGSDGSLACVYACVCVCVCVGGMSRRPVTVPTGPFIFKDITLKGVCACVCVCVREGVCVD